MIYERMNKEYFLKQRRKEARKFPLGPKMRTIYNVSLHFHPHSCFSSAQLHFKSIKKNESLRVAITDFPSFLAVSAPRNPQENHNYNH